MVWCAVVCLVIAGLGLGASGCTGFTLGLNEAGDDTYLDNGRPPTDDGHVGEGEGWCVYNGAIAVDDRTDEVYTLVSTSMVECDEIDHATETTKDLYVVSPTTHVPRRVMDLTDRDDVRVLFPRDKLLVMSERDGHDVLSYLDPATHRVTFEMEAQVRYNGTRMSPSRRFLAVADNTSAFAPIHIIDTEELGLVDVEHDGDWLELQWLHTSDTLVGIVFYDWDGVGIDCAGSSCAIDTVCRPETRARIMTWSLEGAGASSISEDPNGTWSRPELDVTVPGACADMLFSYTWVGISPDDLAAVFPVRAQDEATGEWGYQLLVVSLVDGSVRRVDDAMGPVGFTPDGSTIVSYRYVELPPAEGETEGSTATQLVLIDSETLEETTIDLTEIVEWGPQFFVTRNANVVVITTPFGSEHLVIHDVDTATTTTLENPGWATLNEFVSRDAASELWMVSDGLFRLDYLSPSLEQVALDFTPAHINRLPGADLLVLDDPAAAKLVYFHPDERTVTWQVSLPTPE
jgi:hypothetical protein